MLGVAPQLFRDPYGTFDRIAREHGDVATVPVLGMNIILVSDLDDVKHTLLKHPDLPLAMTDTMFRGEGPRFHGGANGAEWKRVKDALAPKFSLHGLEPLRQTINEAIIETVDDWKRYADTGDYVDMHRVLSLVTMTVMLRAMFTLPAERADVERLVTRMPDLNLGFTVSMVTSGLPGWIPRPFDRRFNAAKNDVFAHIDTMLAERRRNAVDNGDLLSMILNARFDDGGAMSEEQIRRELFGMMFAGYDTTATAMSWVLALMPSAPGAQARANQEADALGGMPASLNDQKRLPWLRACFEEAQRLQGVLFMRETRVDDHLGEFHIPAGTSLIYSGRGLQRDPRWWRDPDRFDPNRFLEGEINRFAFMAFSAGPRACLGRQMAYMVGVSTLAAMFQRYRFEPRPGWRPEGIFRTATIVKGGVPMTISSR
ncbi:MAG: cytochrome P450 [Reyranella sp.]|nr:cytochrome P450 [Reyranella sp.]